MSAVMHAAAFRKLKLPCTYDLFDVGEGDLGSFMERAGKFAGLNVTIPHKVAVMEYLDELSREAELIGAVNTIKINGGKRGYNTDGVGCTRALEENRIEVKGSKVLVLGAGGAARAIVYQLALEGAEVSAANRTRDKAVELAYDVKEKTGLEIDVLDFNDATIKKALSESNILINATSVGMHPREDETPVKKNLMNPDLVVMDLVYNPLKTKLLRDAKDVGCRTIDGVGMLVNQGAESLRIWLGVKPPTEEMRKAVIDELRKGD